MTESAIDPGDPMDAALVEAASRGDLFAWERVVRRYQEPVFRVAYLIVRSTDLAEVATQTAFIRAYRALPSLDRDTRLMPWLFRIVSGEARQQRRESGRPTPSSRPPEPVEGPRLPATAVPGLGAAEGLTSAERSALSGAFDRLGEEDRLTIASRYLFGLSRSDAAAATSMASELLEGHLNSAIKHLRARLASD